MKSQLSQRVWVITGANSGLGLAMASHILAKGDRVIAAVRSVNKLPKSLIEQGVRALALDLSSPDTDIKCAAKNALEAYGHVDVLVNNAGWGVPDPWEEADMDEVRAQFQTLFFGTIAFTQAFLPHFRERRTGYILNVSSAGSFGAFPSWGTYTAAKSALNAFTDSLHGEMKLFGVQVLNVVPGYFPTEFIPTLDKKQRPQSKVYIDPSQGFGGLTLLVESNRAAGEVGDKDKFAARVFEVVTKTGMAENMVLKEGGKYDWTIIPLGLDCDRLLRERLEVMLDNVKAMEPITRSVNMNPEKMRLIPRNHSTSTVKAKL